MKTHGLTYWQSDEMKNQIPEVCLFLRAFSYGKMIAAYGKSASRMVVSYFHSTLGHHGFLLFQLYATFNVAIQINYLLVLIFPYNFIVSVICARFGWLISSNLAPITMLIYS